jgi:hypothetical protein
LGVNQKLLRSVNHRPVHFFGGHPSAGGEFFFSRFTTLPFVFVKSKEFILSEKPKTVNLNQEKTFVFNSPPVEGRRSAIAE